MKVFNNVISQSILIGYINSDLLPTIEDNEVIDFNLEETLNLFGLTREEDLFNLVKMGNIFYLYSSENMQIPGETSIGQREDYSLISNFIKLKNESSDVVNGLPPGITQTLMIPDLDYLNVIFSNGIFLATQFSKR